MNLVNKQDLEFQTDWSNTTASRPNTAISSLGGEPTPGMISALPSSLHSYTLALICSRTSDLISPVSPENRARKPCVRLLITSISCRDTVWTTSFLFCSSPSGHCTNCVCKGLQNGVRALTSRLFFFP